jgi:hypothetical protein
MLSWNKPGDRVLIFQMNSQLQDAQIELLSAHCATDRLRLRFSAEEIARHGQRDILGKIFNATSALRDFYSAIEEKTRSFEITASPEEFEFGETEIAQAIAQGLEYIKEQRTHYLPESSPLSEQHKNLMRPFFSDLVLSAVQFVELNGQRIGKPAIDEQLKNAFKNLPDVTHMDSLTLEDLLVFNETISGRSLFRALVHAVQFQVLGAQRFVELFIRSFLRSESHFNVPLAAHAFTLESRFAANPARPFSVEDQVYRWANQGRYDASGPLLLF